MKIFGRIILSLMGIVAIIILLPWGMRGLGYYVDNTGGEIGRLAAGKKDVSLCKKIIVYSHFFGPSTVSRRRECVYTYASLTKDPSACELLMPSSYGLSCVGAAENHQLPCNTDVKPYSVYWRDGDAEYTVHIRECAKQNTNRTELGYQCCQVAHVAFLKNENDCSSLRATSVVHDRCLYALAWKLKDPNYCIGISNNNAQEACAVQANALRQDPSICSGCTPPVDRIEDLP